MSRLFDKLRTGGAISVQEGFGDAVGMGLAPVVTLCRMALCRMADAAQEESRYA